MRDRSDFGPLVFLLLMAGVSGLAVMAGPAPDTDSAELQTPGEARTAWADRLEHDYGPAMGQCIWSQVSFRMEPVHLDPILQRANGDHRLYPRLNDMVERAQARCRHTASLAAAAMD